MDFETENIEFKSQFTEGIYKEVIAFANTKGGFIYVGINNNGEAVGIKDIDSEYTRITNGIRDAILPDVTMFVHYSIQDNNVVRIAVNEGTNKPYYLKGKGMQPSGVFVRQGTSSVQASFDQIKKLIKENDLESYELSISLEQDLTFESTKKEFDKFEVEFSKNKYRTLGITNNELYTNLALILSDQCKHSIKIAVFSDDARTQFRDSKEFCGSVFDQFNNAVSYLALCNKKKSVIQNYVRIDTMDYPEEAVREALFNAIVHRDYAFSGSIIINITDTNMEIISLGGLVGGIKKEDLLSGISQSRNEKLAEVFHRLHLIEGYGTGIRKIFDLYKDCNIKPRIETTENTFKIILPNMNNPLSYESEKPMTEQMIMVMEEIKDYGEITEEKIGEVLGVKSTRAYILTKQMCKEGYIQKLGRGKTKRYIAKERD